MNMRHIASAAAALGLSVAVPTIASADRRPEAGTNNRAPAANVEHRDAGRQENRQPVQADHREVARNDNRNDRDDRRVQDERRDRDDHRDGDQRRDWDQHRDHDGVWGGVNVYVPAPYYTPDFDTPMSLQSVPPFVLDTAARTEPGLRIESVDYIRQSGNVFYSVRLDRGRQGDVFVRVSADGTLIGIQ
jgi:hypothetical protein